MVQRYEQKRRLQWYKRGAAYFRKTHYLSNVLVFYYDQLQSSMMAELRDKVKSCEEL